MARTDVKTIDTEPDALAPTKPELVATAKPERRPYGVALFDQPELISKGSQPSFAVVAYPPGRTEEVRSVQSLSPAVRWLTNIDPFIVWHSNLNTNPNIVDADFLYYPVPLIIKNLRLYELEKTEQARILNEFLNEVISIAEDVLGAAEYYGLSFSRQLSKVNLFNALAHNEHCNPADHCFSHYNYMPTQTLAQDPKFITVTLNMPLAEHVRGVLENGLPSDHWSVLKGPCPTLTELSGSKRDADTAYLIEATLSKSKDRQTDSLFLKAGRKEEIKLEPLHTDDIWLTLDEAIILNRSMTVTVNRVLFSPLKKNAGLDDWLSHQATQGSLAAGVVASALGASLCYSQKDGTSKGPQLLYYSAATRVIAHNSISYLKTKVPCMGLNYQDNWISLQVANNYLSTLLECAEQQGWICIDPALTSCIKLPNPKNSLLGTLFASHMHADPKQRWSIEKTLTQMVKTNVQLAP